MTKALAISTMNPISPLRVPDKNVANYAANIKRFA